MPLEHPLVSWFEKAAQDPKPCELGHFYENGKCLYCESAICDEDTDCHNWVVVSDDFLDMDKCTYCGKIESYE